MGLSCGMSMVKYGLFVTNLICAIAGIALIVVGSIPLFRIDDIRDLYPEHEPTIIPIAVIVLGSIIFVISFFGCCGAIRESQCMVSTYAFFLFVLVILQIVVAVYAFLYTEDVANSMSRAFDDLWNSMNNNDAAAREAVNGIQRALQCCGRTGPSDWTNSSAGQIPTSCCNDGLTTCTAATAFPNGCGTVLHDAVYGSGMLIAWIAVVFGALELVGVIFACCLANSIRNQNRRQYA